MGALRSVYVELDLKVRGFLGGIATGRQALKGFVGEIDTLADKHRARFEEINRNTAMVGAGMLVAVGYLAKVSSEFDKQMSAVAAVADSTAAELDQLRQAALRAGADTAFSATQAAKAEEELAKAGLSTAEILGGALSGSLSLAAAGGLDLAESAEIAAKTMNVFKLQGKDVGHIADVLASAANKSATDVHELGEALKMGGLGARSAGMSLEQTVGTLAAFADNALAGSDGGTSLKTALQMLQAPTEKAANLMRDLGIQAYDASGNFIGTAKLAGNLQSALGDLTQEERNRAIVTIFGADAMRAANVLYDLGEQKILDYTAAVNDQGAAARNAATRMDNLSGDVEKLTGSLETLTIQSSGGATSALRTLVQAADNLAGSLSVMPSGLSNAAVLITGVGGAAMLAAAGAAKLRQSSASALETLTEMGPRGATAARGLEKVQRGATKVAVALAAMQVAGAVLGESQNVQINAYGEALADWAKDGKLAGEAARVLGDDLSNLKYDLNTIDTGFWTDTGNAIAGTIEGLTGTGQLFDESLTHATERVGALDSALAGLVQNGRGDDAAAILTKIAAAGAEEGVTLDELKHKLPGYSAALDAVTRAADPVAISQRKAAESARELAGGWQGAATEAEGLINMFNKLNGAATGWISAEINAEEAVDQLSEAFRKNGFTLDVNTEKGRENKKLVLEGAQAAAEAAQKKFDETQSVEQAQATYQKYINKVREAIDPLNRHKKAVDGLIGSIASMPPLKATQIVTPGLDQAVGSSTALRNVLRDIPTKTYKEVTVTYRYSGKQSAERAMGNRWGGAYEKAAAGTLREASIYSATNPGRYMIAEPETGGEAFIPKRGDYGRNMSILSTAAGWNDASVVPNRAWRSGAGGTTTIVHEHHHTLTLNGTSVLSGLRGEVDLRGGDVQKVIGSRR